ncbi:MAG: rubredoxin [Bacteroidota bacterium]
MKLEADNLVEKSTPTVSRPSKFKDLVRVFLKGGIISPGDLLKVTAIAEQLGAGHIHFGSRQDILIPAIKKDPDLIKATLEPIHLDFEINDFRYQNIASSYVALDVQPSKKWLASHLYHYILESFDYLPILRINIVDPSQSLVPLFSGHINFLASNQENYWYVYLRFQNIQNTPWQLPVLVYGEDICRVSKFIESLKLENNGVSYQNLSERLEEANVRTQPVTEELQFASPNFPYYEGFNRMYDTKYWLGLYWRNNNFNLEILKAICHKCLQTEVGKISLTTWKSLIIKGISEKYITGWEKLLGKLGMNLRHSALEMNWHLPALDREAYELKTQLVRTLDQQDISTYGLTFSIKTTDDITLFTSIVIEKVLDQTDSYNILYSKDFNPNLTEYTYYAQNIPKDVVASLLIELSRVYFDQLEDAVPKTENTESEPQKLVSNSYTCNSCLSEYNPEYGDEVNGIVKDTSFEQLPETYQCPLCGAGKDNFSVKI